jgi:hypothetical protein
MNTNPGPGADAALGQAEVLGLDVGEVPLCRHVLELPSSFQAKPWKGQRISLQRPS